MWFAHTTVRKANTRPSETTHTAGPHGLDIKQPPKRVMVKGDGKPTQNQKTFFPLATPNDKKSHDENKRAGGTAHSLRSHPRVHYRERGAIPGARHRHNDQKQNSGPCFALNVHSIYPDWQPPRVRTSHPKSPQNTKTIHLHAVNNADCNFPQK